MGPTPLQRAGGLGPIEGPVGVPLLMGRPLGAAAEEDCSVWVLVTQ